MIYIYRLVVDFLKDKSYRNLTISTILILLNGTIIYHFVEGWRWLDSFYFSVITLTTVGYGDFYPKTDFAKIFTIVYILAGIGIIFGFINAFYQHRTSKRDKWMSEKKSHFSKNKLDQE